jgi:putative redox protein
MEHPMSPSKPSVTVELRWDGELRFNARVGSNQLVIDSDGRAGPSPVQALALGLAGCMAVDVVHILRKGRHPLQGLRVTLTGQRAEEEPRRLVAVDLHFALDGAVPNETAARAIELSREKYCSVWHSLRQDIALRTGFDITGGSADPAG